MHECDVAGNRGLHNKPPTTEETGLLRVSWDHDAGLHSSGVVADRDTARLHGGVGASGGVDARLAGRVGVETGNKGTLGDELDADLAAAMMSINAVKGVEIGDGFAAAALRGEDNADEMRAGNGGRPRFMANHAGGILGGISSGEPVVVRFAVKPTSSILTPRRSVTRDGAEVDLVTKGRHDPCVGIRAVPVAEAMMACVLADHYLRHRGQVGSQP